MEINRQKVGEGRQQVEEVKKSVLDRARQINRWLRIHQ